MPSLKQLQYLAAIAETHHFARAAELCHVTQPTLSTQLAAFEKRLGLALVERAQHGAHLTPAGRLILERAEIALRSVEEIREIARAGKKGVVGTVRIGVLPTLGPYMLPELLPDIHHVHPQLKLYVREELSEDLIANLHRGKHDAVFTSLPIGSTNLQIRPLFWEPIVVAIPSGHRLSEKTALLPGDLKGEAVLTLEPGHILHRQVRDVCEKYGAELQLDYEGTSLDTLRIMVGMGMGIALFPALYVRSEIPKDANVKVAKLPDAKTGRTIVLVSRSSSPRARDYDALSKSLRQFIRSKFSDVVRLVS
ncbi:hydrogen peroxide-inducible genes activator [Hyphomicrobium sp. CS1GBMeth3]|uniref:hydrogen peroxide-inducible genes activator n=1 Tax=Hyphomicrobium sp. CS1GBMeth3 TaxID=1892845 RepID=UPI0009305B5C|nr:hydrogen peroxide-inducible genes activator [Hyphomicrobium sp. CS1GBMeth3]